ncbi:thioesterase II family protein [Micromonospora rifamycinica]|uniref:Surfactin synthase thioesterase subunit n=1 Tax=Micromonospora rifamycinica TaxID=291594 RepID=A0A109IIX9_9ACTN|nr:alpha/beta fold hydrolase [Micromonospora rifamycinica]KWV31390.1 oleoyl-ACP hydrolase [Micromonospora rifamycinica]SCG47874.1 Surfactin synthase thioesterase subunit [Micromonospora rifamycinica]
MTEEESRWIRRFHQSPDAEIRLFCLPHAGGSASYFFPMSRSLTPAVEVLPVQYPGRQDRRFEACVDDLHELADRVFAAVRGLADRPVAFFGHSMGAALAFEVALRMEATLGVSPRHLIVSGRRAPSTSRVEQVHLRDDDGIVAELRTLSGTADDMLGDHDILRMILPAIRADYRAIETYRGRSDGTVRAPITVLTGDADPRVSLGEAHRWRSHTTGAAEVLVFPGGHFYLNDCRNDVNGVVARILAEA